MNRIKHISATFTKDLDISLNLPPYLIRCTKRQHALCIDATAPKSNLITKTVFQFLRIHINRRNLDGIENIKSGFNNVRYQWHD